MANIALLWDNKADAGSILASSQVSTMPASEVQTYPRTRRWRSAAAAAHLDLTLAAATAIQGLALADHNLPATGTITLTGWSNAIGGTVVYGPTVLDAWPGQTIPAGALATRVHLLAAPVTARYWRVAFAGTGLAYIELGRLFLGPIWQPDSGVAWGGSHGVTHRSTAAESPGGQVSGTWRPPRRTWSGDIEYLADAEQEALDTIHRSAGPLRPMFALIRPYDTMGLRQTALYCTIDECEIESVAPDLHNASISLLESL